MKRERTFGFDEVQYALCARRYLIVLSFYVMAQAPKIDLTSYEPLFFVFNICNFRHPRLLSYVARRHYDTSIGVEFSTLASNPK